MTSVISKNIRYLRKEKKMSQLSLANKLGKSESAIQMWESDKRSPTMATTQAISDIFAIDINTLVYVDLSTGKRFQDGNVHNDIDDAAIEDVEQIAYSFINNPHVAHYAKYNIHDLTIDEKKELVDLVLNSVQFFAKRYK